MQNANIKNYLHLHFLVFIAGFTAILGNLISIGSIDLVWYRMVIAGILMWGYILYKRYKLKISFKNFMQYSVAGLLIALHWITFFESIKQSNVSIALAMFSTGAFFASFLEPLFYRRKIKSFEILLGIVVILGVYLITKSELQYINGILLGIVSALFSTSFAILNGNHVKTERPSIIAFYEFISGVFFITIFHVNFRDGFSKEFFDLSLADLTYLIILASICTAYAFIAVIKIMKYITPYTVVLTYNLEPVYGIILAVILFPAQEIMGLEFYIGATLVIGVVILNEILSRRNLKLNKEQPKEL